MIIRRSILSLLVLLAGLSSQQAAPDLSEHQQRVVKIVTSNGTGAGIVLGTEVDRVVIATAFHVVKGSVSGQCKSDGEIQVAFSFQRDVAGGARLRACRPQVDLAVLDVIAPAAAAALSRQPPLCAADARRQSRAYVIGHAMKDWAIGAESIIDIAFEGDSRRFILTGNMSGPGASGGMVLDDSPCLLGLYTDHTPSASIATRTAEAVNLAEANRLSVNLMGGNNPIDKVRRRGIFNDVSETFNDYLFKMEAVSALFRRKAIRSAELAQVITEYNTAFNKWYQRRTALSADIESQWGQLRGQDFDRVTNKLYGLHNRVVYNQLRDIVASLSMKNELSSGEQKRLRELLPQLDEQLAVSKQEVTQLLERMKPLLSGM